jgi:hypothetical protein
MTLDAALARLRAAHEAFARRYPGDAGERQPIHTLYIGAHTFRADTMRALADRALAVVDEHAPDADTFAAAAGLPGAIAAEVRSRVMDKLRRQPVEDLRLDFEDGYGNRPDAEEDGHADSVAEELAAAHAAGALPPFVGIRIKPMSNELAARSLRTLERFVATLVGRAGGLPPGFVVTLTKIVAPEEVEVPAACLDELEARLGLACGAIPVEIMVETTQCVLDADGRSMLPRLVAAAAGRCRGAHFGTYDYTTGSDIAAHHQRMRHPACDFAKQVMKTTLAGTGVWLSDGSTAVLPIGDRDAVHAAWRLHADDVRHSLVGGFYQGWDLHAAQLPTRYAAVYGFFREALASASARLAAYLDRATREDAGDDPHTGQALLGFFLRARACGAIDDEEVRAAGITPDELAGRSFARILAARRAAR